MDVQRERVGFIGLGRMGKPMAMNLLKAGFELIVWNRTRSKMEELLSMGAAAAHSPKDLAEHSDVVITIVSDTPDVMEVILGDNGVIHGVREGMVVIDMSTISPCAAQQIAAALSERGVQFLDAPVTGGEKGAIEATLNIMVGGDEKTLERCMPIFKALGKKVVHMGGNGMGQVAKLANQIICAINILAVCEGLMFAKKLGLDMNKLLDAISDGAASSWMLSNLAPKMLERDFEPGFSIRLQLKDIRLALEMAQKMMIPLPVTALVGQLMRAVEALGFGDKGTQATILALERLSGVEVNW
ncbi:MAG: NAD(P)-dependent oxidoreductase [Armatimonadota bacterium]|nr:NAD(P)-dependent oxidoreductase [Armatimonadota bacterium]MCX7777601.1 NAD(P)-dependent oxidoreductase [Armatimonadota bacterium]MDW8024721.1 NAD(P)-dependent oxidoreductase [Armatimonadota bacterium]